MKSDIGFLFDLDGVLIDSEREYTRIWTLIDGLYPSGTDNFARRIKGSTLDKILGEYYNDGDIREKVVELLYSEEKKMAYDYCPYAEQLLDELDSRDIPHALVTSSNEYKMGRLFSDLPGFRRHFIHIVDSSCVSRSKPDPDGYLKGASALNVSPSRCVVFEDSVQGVMAGRAAGAYVIGVSGTVDASLLYPYADRIVDSLDQVDIDEISDILRMR